MLLSFAESIESSTAQACYLKAGHHVPIIRWDRDGELYSATCTCGEKFSISSNGDVPHWQREFSAHIRALAGGTSSLSAGREAPDWREQVSLREQLRSSLIEEAGKEISRLKGIIESGREAMERREAEIRASERKEITEWMDAVLSSGETVTLEGFRNWLSKEAGRA
jgi:hypothetical protein